MAKSPRARRKAGQSAPGRLRIVAGKWRRRLLPVVDAPGLRPTSERIRETLFNWLAPRIDGARCLDLFAGSGALGFEAVSRGALQAVLVEQSRSAVKGMQASAELLQDGDLAELEIVQADALRFLQKSPGQQYDIVFLDPPYQDALLPELCRLLESGDWLADDALVYLEYDRKSPPSLPNDWQVVKQSKAGRVSYCLMSPQAATAAQE